MTNSSFLYMKILWRRSTEAEITFGERLSPATSLRMAPHALRAHGFLARRECERGCKRAGFSPGAPAFCCTRLKSAKNLYLSHRFFNKIRQIHRFFCIFRLEFSKQVQRLVMVDFPRALPTQSLTWPQIELIIYCLNLSITNR